VHCEGMWGGGRHTAKLTLISKPVEGESIYLGGSQIKLKAANI